MRPPHLRHQDAGLFCLAEVTMIYPQKTGFILALGLGLAIGGACSEPRDPAGTQSAAIPKEQALSATTPVQFKTGPPERLDRFVALPLSPPDEYFETIAPLSERLIPIRAVPADLRRPALYGFNVVFDGGNHSYIVDGDAKAGYRLFIDLDGDGDLQEERPRHFVPHSGQPTLILEPTTAERGLGHGFAPVLVIVFEIRAPKSQQGTSLPFSVWKSDQTLRRGTAKLPDRDYAFGLIGENGVYARDYQVTVFDIDGDGRLDLSEDPLSPERYILRERYVQLGGRGYEFGVASDGSTLTLTPLSKDQAPRPDVRPSFPAPALRLSDFLGRPRDLTEFRGKWIVLDFWAAWCQPCVRAAPELTRARRELSAQGLEIVGVYDGEPDEPARKFIHDHDMSWPQLVDADKSAQSLYRVTDLPTYVLIDPSGTIVTRESAWQPLRAILDARLVTAP